MTACSEVPQEVAGGRPASDLDGGARVIGTTVDRGAYESRISDAFIQIVQNNNDSGNNSAVPRRRLVDHRDSGGCRRG
jgi:hypothetical protein